MTGRDRFRAALSGADIVAFAPLAWARLPDFLHLARPAAFWLDAGAMQRMLGDAVSVCAADAYVVPMLPRPPEPGAGPPPGAGPSPGSGPRPGAGPSSGGAAEVVSRPEVVASATLLRRLADAGGPGTLAELPPLADLAGLMPGAAPEDLEDALTDLARAGLEAGAQAVCVRGARAGDAAAGLDAIAPLADFYGAPALGVDGERGWAAGGTCRVGVLGRDGRWPDLPRGVVLTAGDVTRWWTPQEVRALPRERQGAG